MDNMRRMSFQTSSLAHSRKRLCTVFQGPNSGCKSRHGAPVFIIHRIALNIRRSSLRLRPLVSVPAFANIGPIMAHFSSEMSCLLMEKQKQRTDEKSRFYLETAPKAAQENFGGNERRTPYRDDGDGDDITADLALHGRSIRDCIVARYAAACRKEPSCAARHRVAYKPMKVARAFIINLLPFRIIWSDKAKPRMLF